MKILGVRLPYDPSHPILSGLIMGALLWGLGELFATYAFAVTACSWDHPGANKYRGDVVKAIDSYKDIPAATRKILKERIKERQYDEFADITRDSIKGKDVEYVNLRQMHFGSGKVCHKVSREKWKPGHMERGFIYCEGGHCVIIPTVCNNVSRVDRVVPPLVFDPPGAGVVLPPIRVTPEIPPGGDFTSKTPITHESYTFHEIATAFTPVYTYVPRGGYAPYPWPPLVVVPPSVPEGPPVSPPKPSDPEQPVVPPLEPPVDPPTNPPSHPPVDPPPTPPEEPPVRPPVDPPVKPPIIPDPPVSPPVPEPSTILLGLVGAAILARKFKKK